MDARPATALFRLPSLAPRSAAPPRVLLWWGITLICIGVLGFCFILYATLLSKLLPPSGVPILDAIRSDCILPLAKYEAFQTCIAITTAIVLGESVFHPIQVVLYLPTPTVGS